VDGVNLEELESKRISELEAWFVSEYRDRLLLFWQIETSKIDKYNEEELIPISEIINYRVTEINDLIEQNYKLLTFLWDKPKLKAPLLALIPKFLENIFKVAKSYQISSKGKYPETEFKKTWIKVQDFFVMQYKESEIYLDAYKEELLAIMPRENSPLRKHLSELAHGINLISDIMNNIYDEFRSMIKKDFKSFALTSNIELNSGNENLKDALSQYLGEVNGKSKKGAYFNNELFSYDGRTWQCEEIKKAFKTLKRQSKKDEATRVKLAAYADQYKKTFKDYTLEEFPSNKANSIESLSKQASKISKDTIVKLLQDYLIKNKPQNRL
jgi:hypothetical protein